MRFFYNLVLEGEKVPALDVKPNLFEDLIWIWEAFCTLNSCRGAGMSGPLPITFTEMRSMANELKIKGSPRHRFFHRIGILDRAYIEYCQEQPPETKKGK